MSDMMMKPVTLGTIAGGVANELFATEMAKVAANIQDINTPHTAKRKITIEFMFAPDDERRETKVTVSAKTTLAPIKSFSKTVWCGKSGGKPTMYSQDDKQLNIIDINNRETPL